MQAFDTVPEDDIWEFSDAADDVAKQLLKVEPTSFGGVAALLAYYANRMIKDDTYFAEDHSFSEEEGCHCFGVKVALLAARSVAKIAARAEYANYAGSIEGGNHA